MSDYISIRKAYLAHASMAGMPTNVARKLGYKNVTGNVNSHVGALEKAEARVTAAKKRMDELDASMNNYMDNMYNGFKNVYSLNPAKRLVGWLKFVDSMFNRSDLVNAKNEYEKASNEYMDAVRRRNEIKVTIDSYRKGKSLKEQQENYRKAINRKFNNNSKAMVSDADKWFAEESAKNKAAADSWYEQKVAEKRRSHQW